MAGMGREGGVPWGPGGMRHRGWQEGARVRFGLPILPELSRGDKEGPRLGLRNWWALGQRGQRAGGKFPQ